MAAQHLCTVVNRCRNLKLGLKYTRAIAAALMIKSNQIKTGLINVRQNVDQGADQHN